MMKRYLCLAITLACSLGQSWAATPAADAADGKNLWGNEKNSCKELPPASSTRLGLIRQMLTAGKPHAAIAYLDAARLDVPQAELLRADGLRQTGREEEADRIYRKLLKSCVSGYAYQGLGLSASNAGKWRDAAGHLKAASAALPVDASVRNDYGYALMLTGDHQAALHEFLTAIELAPNQRRAAHNLLLLLSRTGEDDKAAAFAEKVGISAEELAGIRQMAARQLSATPQADSPATGMIGPVPDSDAAQDETNNRNETGANDETENRLAGGVVAADRHDGAR
jgi:Flp pilus assembly protein TadD